MRNSPAIKRGRTFFATLLRRTAQSPVTINECMAEFGVRENGATTAMQAMNHLRLVHIAHWVPRYRQPSTPAYAFGDGIDCPYPARTPDGRIAAAPRKRRATPHLPSELIALNCLIVEMQRAVSATVPHLSAATGIPEAGVYALMEMLHGLGLAHIASYDHQRHGGNLIVNWSWGLNQRDARRPSRKELRRMTNQRYYWGRKAKDEQLRLIHAVASNGSRFTEAQAA